MFAARYFNPRYWAARFWAKVGAESIEVPTPGLFITTDKQQSFSTNINSPVLLSDKKTVYTTNLGG